MEISYKRTHKESYMIISTEEYVSDYEEQMLKENEIRSLLSFYTMEMNGRIQFWYDISGKQSLKDYLQQKEVTYESMEEVPFYIWRWRMRRSINIFCTRTRCICARRLSMWQDRDSFGFFSVIVLLKTLMKIRLLP